MEDRLLKLKQFIPDILPISESAWWAGIKAGKYPKLVKLGPRTSAWRESEIMQIVENGILEESDGEQRNA